MVSIYFHHFQAHLENNESSDVFKRKENSLFKYDTNWMFGMVIILVSQKQKHKFKREFSSTIPLKT